MGTELSTLVVCDLLVVETLLNILYFSLIYCHVLHDIFICTIEEPLTLWECKACGVCSSLSPYQTSAW